VLLLIVGAYKMTNTTKELIGHGFSLRNRVETLKAEVNTLCNVTEQLQTRVEELERENFALSAFQCHSGKSDAGGNMRCDFQDEIVQLQARCEHLEVECETWKNKHAVLADKIGEPDSYKCVVYDLQDPEAKIRNRLVSMGWTPPNHEV
jgi:chaperonin cofactor prefoldin